MINLEDLENERNRFIENPEQIDADYIKGLRDLADFLETNTHLIPRYNEVNIPVFVNNADEMLVMATGGGLWEKRSNDIFYALDKKFGRHSISIMANRDVVCEKIEVGQETVEVIDPDAPMVTVTRPVYEWKCPESLLGKVK